ncbi:hypothetical protein BGZ99_003167 [Dissophora globulifera]|uniref:Xylanolytic transcriptional activator regulatory domain-containing protein n=1 Tax=Dissophora globulifera TaxID=979702 RepID=A0A9P6RNX9_9FUNG|nr:hypothetical protein BGZ99_003167 [Dissophora globulifera]
MTYSPLTMSMLSYCLDSFHGSSSGFYICQLSSRFRQGIYPLPMAYLNDSDLWSHSLQMTSERELPPREMINSLLNLYFQYMYPFAPIFIRKTFMEHHRQNRPDLSQILILNAIFCNACRYSDDVAVKQESTKYFNRAKIILDETYHISKITTTQALMLMSHHQYATGNYSGGWLYSGMAIRIAVDLGLHRQDVHTDEPEYKEVRKRVWWALYISDRLGSGVLGRPMTLRDEAFNIDLPSDEWIPHVIGEDVVEYPYEPERIISCRLLWSIKLFMHMGKMLNTMHCIEAEVSGTFLADMSRSQLPQIHNSLTSWFMSLPTELMYAPYTMSPGNSHPPSPPTALMHMFYYTCLTMLHRPYLRLVNSSAIDSNFLLSSRNICTAAATNVCHIADSLMLHGQLRDTCFYGMSCLFAAGTVHVHNAMTPTLSNQETTRAGISKTVKAAQELVKTFPVAESLIAIALDVFASHKSSLPSDMETSFVDISTFVAPLMDKTQLQSTSIGNIHEAARLATLAKDGPESAPSIQLRHPYGDFSMPLPTETSLKTVGDSDPCGSGSNNKEGGRSIKLGIVWQTQIATAVAMAAIAFGGTDPTLQPESDMPQEQHFFANSLELPEALRLAPIDTMTTISQVDRMMPPVTTNTSTSVPGIAVGGSGVDYGLDVFGTSGPLGLGHIQSVGEGNGVEMIDHGMQQWMQQQQQQQLYFQQFQEQHQHRQQQQQQQGSTVAIHVSHAGGAMMLGSYSQSSSDPHSGNVESSDGSSTSNINNTSLLTEEPITSILMQELSSLHTPALQIEMHMQKQEGQQQQQQQRHATMEDYGADPLTPPAISSDDMDIEASSLSDGVDHVKYSRSDNNIGSPKRALQGAMSAVPERELKSAQ